MVHTAKLPSPFQLGIVRAWARTSIKNCKNFLEMNSNLMFIHLKLFCIFLFYCLFEFICLFIFQFQEKKLQVRFSQKESNQSPNLQKINPEDPIDVRNDPQQGTSSQAVCSSNFRMWIWWVISNWNFQSFLRKLTCTLYDPTKLCCNKTTLQRPYFSALCNIALDTM